MPQPAPSLSARAYDSILRMIADGTLQLGDRLPSEVTLSEQFGMSRPVLRQALKQLREDGVIASRQGSGSFVQRRPETVTMAFTPAGSIADIQRIFEFRTAIEGEAAFLAAERRSEADLERLDAAFAELDRCVERGELGVEADEALHEAVFRASGNPYFLDARTSMKPNILLGINLTRSLSLTKPMDRMRLVQKEHWAILNAIRGQDPHHARNAMRAHIESARVRMFEDRDLSQTSPVKRSS